MINFKLHVALEKLVISDASGKNELNKITSHLRKIICNDIKIYDIMKNRDEIYGPQLGIDSNVYMSDYRPSYLGLTLEFKGAPYAELFDAIYKAFHYLENFSSSKELWTIEVEYPVYYKIENEKFYVSSQKERISWEHDNYGDIDVLEILEYICTKRPTPLYFEKYFSKFKSKIDNRK